MKKGTWILGVALFLFGIVSSGGTSAWQSVHAETNTQTVPNGDFDDLNEDGSPSGWNYKTNLYGADASAAQVSFSYVHGDAAYGGKGNSLKISNTSTDERVKAVVSSAVFAVSPNTRYALSYGYKKGEGSIGHVLKEYDADRLALEANVSTAVVKEEANDYQFAKVLFSTSEETSFVAISFEFGVGKDPYYLDMVSLDPFTATGFNFGMDAFTGTNVPYDWQVTDESACSIARDVAYDGSSSLHVKRNDPVNAFTLTSKGHFSIEGGNRYRVGMRLASKNSPSMMASVVAHTYDKNGIRLDEALGGHVLLNSDSNLSPWTDIFLEFNAKDSAVSGDIGLELYQGSADVYIDGVYAKKAGETIFSEDFNLPTQNATIPSFQGGVAENGKLTIPSGQEASMRLDSYLSNYGYAVSFWCGGDAASGTLKVEYYDFGKHLVDTDKKDFLVDQSRVSLEILCSASTYAVLTFSSQGSGSLQIDDLTIVETYEPSDSNNTWKSSWVVYPDASITNDSDGQNRWYRKTFDLTEEVDRAVLQITADDARFAYLNGEQVDVSGAWNTPTVLEVGKQLHTGKNVLAVRVYNGTYYSGLLFEFTIFTTSGRTITIGSDRDVLCSKTLDGLTIFDADDTGKDWIGADYDDSSWLHAQIVCKPGEMPWGNISYYAVTNKIPKMEVNGLVLPSEASLGDTITFTVTIKAIEAFAYDVNIPVRFWGKYSSDIDSNPAAVMLRQIEGPSPKNWPLNQNVTLKYEVDIPDYIEAGSYYLQFDPDTVEVVNNSLYTNNKIRDSIIRFLEVKHELTKAEVKKDGNGTHLVMDGQTYAPLMYLRESSSYFKTSYASNLYASDLKIFCLRSRKTLDTTDGSLLWTGPGQYDFSSIDDEVYETLTGAPKAKLMVMIFTEPPAWWIQAHPEECVMVSDGKKSMVSYASMLWRKEVSAYITAYIDHLKKQPYASHIFAVKFASGETFEWQDYGQDLGTCPDFSKVAQEAFRAWLRDKYGNDAALQKAWNNYTVTLDTAHVPAYGERTPQSSPSLLDGKNQRNVIDFQLFVGDQKTDAMNQFGKVVHEASDNHWISGTYNGYLTNVLTYESNDIANSSFRRLLESPDVDFFSGPLRYNYRQSGYDGGFMQLVDSIQAAGKLTIMEADNRTVKCVLPGFSSRQIDEWGKTYTLYSTIAMMMKNFGTCISHGAAMWLYDMLGGWFDDEEIYHAVQVIASEWTHAQTIDTTSNAEVAFFLDDYWMATMAYSFAGSYFMSYTDIGGMMGSLSRLGAPYDYYLLSEFEKGLPKEYKVYVILANTVSEAAARGITNTAKKNGSTIIWIGTPGYYGSDTSSSQEYTSSLVDMDISYFAGSAYAVTVDDTASEYITGANGRTYGNAATKQVGPIGYVTDETASSLGHLYGEPDKVGFAVKEVQLESGGSYTSIYSSVGNLPTETIRAALVKAGGHIYDTSLSDIVYANASYLTIDSPFGGNRLISLPGSYDVYDVARGEYIATNVSSFEVTLEAGNTVMYRLDPVGSANPKPSSAKQANYIVPILVGAIGGSVALTIGICLGLYLTRKRH